ncbi:WD40 repeat domain-containing protein [Catellatospora tritici]|uniref:WD40 repeat domain-containing protein n=1 Tax=Catellatospora tritici TaxID=2851566 RepID=UPI001C2D857E|nr:WD40 repeat domain-containing protein [Catellatospora tritici]MBV1856537.1 hypothetical protein [Catellatospora tritici]
MTGLADRAVEVIHDAGPAAARRWTCSSGLLIGARLVLTAAHAVPPGGTVTVRRADKVELAATVRLRGDESTADLAIVELAAPVGQLPPLGYGTVRRDGADQVPGCRGIGYPDFQTVRRDGGPPVRDTAQLDGVIPTAEQRIADLLTLRVTSAPRPLPPQQEALGASPWSGVSGTVVVTSYEGTDVVVGVVTEHRPRAGDGALTLTPLHHIDRLADAASWWTLLGTEPDLLVPLPRAADRPAYLATVAEVAARTPVLLERAAELAELTRFATGQTAGTCRWLTAPPWAGKTALVAHLAARPPEGVDVVAYLMQRRALDASGERFRTAVCGQLAALLDEPTPAAADPAALTQLWNRAADRARRTGRRLLLIVDGLDEDLRPAGERSVAALLPTGTDAARVLVTSRHTFELPDDLDPDHPLWLVTPHPIGQAVPAARIEQRAGQELRALLGDGATRRLLGLLSAAGGPLRTAELAALDRTDPFEVETALRERAGRVLDGTGGAWRFAHQTLLDECRDTVFGPERLAPFLDAVDEWARDWQDRAWPAATPHHLLEYHPWALLARGETARLTALLTDPRWLDSALSATGVDAVLTLLRSVADRRVAAVQRLLELEAHRLRAGDGDRAGQLCLAAVQAGLPLGQLDGWAEAVGRQGLGLIARSVTRGVAPALVRSLDPQAGQVWTVRFLDDATVLTGDGDGRLLVWNLADGRFEQLGAHAAAVHAAAVSPGGDAIVSCGNDRTVRLSFRDGSPPVPIGGASGQVWSVAYAPDGKQVAAAGRDRTIRVWDLAEPRDLVVGEHTDQVRALAYTPDGRMLVSGGRDSAIRIWYLAEGTGAFLGGHDGWVECLAVTPDGAHAVAGSYDGVVRVWPLNGGAFRDLGRHEAQVWTVAVSPDGAWVVSGGGDGQVLAWPLAGGQPKALGRHDAPVRCVAVSPDGRHVLSSAAEGPVRLWDLTAADTRAHGDDTELTTVAVSPDGTLVFAGHHDGRVVCHQDATARTLGSHGLPVRALAAGGAGVAGGADDGTVRWWSVDPGTPPLTLGEPGGPVRALAWDGEVLVCADTQISRWTGGRRVGGADVGPEILALATTGDGTMVTGHGSGTVRRIGVDGAVTRLRSGGAQVWAVDAHGEVAVTGDRAGQLLLWSLREGTCRVLGGHRGTVTGVALAGPELVVSSGQDGVRVWDTATGHTAYVATGPITALAAAGGTVATASRELGLAVWRLSTRHAR